MKRTESGFGNIYADKIVFGIKTMSIVGTLLENDGRYFKENTR